MTGRPMRRPELRYRRRLDFFCRAVIHAGVRRGGQWLRELGELTEHMLWGSFQPVFRRCGHPGCHCASGEKHGPIFYLCRREEGRTRNIFVPTELHEDVQAGVAAFRRYRELGLEIAEANLRTLGLERKPRR